MSLEAENRKAIVDYRIEKAFIALEDADFLTEAGKYNIAANRLYYALYYAASALLISKGIPTKTHSGLLTQISLNLVKTGILSNEDGKLLKVMFELRHEGDYEDFIEVTREDIEEYTPCVRELVDKLKNLIEI
jgi:uncharacterized protein (UPF0332 family)